jgi:Spy/CpxP family protein refolding chaperone
MDKGVIPMRKFLIPALLISAVAVSAPAAAQHRGGYDPRPGYGQHHGGGGIERQIDQLEQRIDRLRDRRLISNREAQRLMRQAEDIDRLHDRYRRNGLSRYEHDDLMQRIQYLRQNIRYERQEGRQDRYDDRYDDRRDRW